MGIANALNQWLSSAFWGYLIVAGISLVVGLLLVASFRTPLPEKMSDAARWMIAFAFISLPTIAFGGYFLLSILKRQTGTENVTSEQRDYFRAGHAHAGVLVLLAIVGQLVLDESRLSELLSKLVHRHLLAKPALI